MLTLLFGTKNRFVVLTDGTFRRQYVWLTSEGWVDAYVYMYIVYKKNRNHFNHMHVY